MSIPKIIHYCWFGRGEIPERDRKCIESWHKFCPDYEIIQWNEDNYDITQNPYIKEAYEAGRWAFVSDFARIDVVHRYGGIYLDTDVELIRPLDELLTESGYFGIEVGVEYISMGLGFGAEAGSSVLKELCDHYRTRSFRNADGTVDLKPNPIIVTEFLQENKGLRLNTAEVQRFEGFTIYPAEYFCPQDFKTGKVTITDKTFSIHHYHASWQTEEERKSSKVYQRITKLIGARMGELVLQAIKTLKNDGFLATVKKMGSYFRKK